MNHQARSGLAAIALAAAAGIGAVAFRSAPSPSPVRAAAPLIVHEWGTITTVHAPNGTPSGCLNQISSSEPLPEFVHKFEPAGLKTPAGSGDVNSPGGLERVPLVKTWTGPCRPDVTMRLETPVIYFHPGIGGADGVPPLDVTVHFRGGVLNEFYPNASPSVSVDVEQPDTRAHPLVLRADIGQPWNGGLLDSSVIGKLHWTGVSLLDTTSLPQTSAHVWLAPRQVQAADLRTSAGEGERYLFYRGVAHLDAVIGTQRDAASIRLVAPSQLDWMRGATSTVAGAWLVDIQANGMAAFHSVAPMTLSKAAPSVELASVPLFKSDEYKSSAITELRAAMKRSLVLAGLADDEAAAMLETWSNSYFRTPGLRLFYLVPRDWTDYFLPLDISVPSTITRVLVGRVDLTN
jgi:hypothetical protein